MSMSSRVSYLCFFCRQSQAQVHRLIRGLHGGSISFESTHGGHGVNAEGSEPVLHGVYAVMVTGAELQGRRIGRVARDTSEAPRDLRAAVHDAPCPCASLGLPCRPR